MADHLDEWAELGATLAAANRLVFDEALGIVRELAERARERPRVLSVGECVASNVGDSKTSID